MIVKSFLEGYYIFSIFCLVNLFSVRSLSRTKSLDYLWLCIRLSLLGNIHTIACVSRSDSVHGPINAIETLKEPEWLSYFNEMGLHLPEHKVLKQSSSTIQRSFYAQKAGSCCLNRFFAEFPILLGPDTALVYCFHDWIHSSSISVYFCHHELSWTLQRGMHPGCRLQFAPFYWLPA